MIWRNKACDSGEGRLPRSDFSFNPLLKKRRSEKHWTPQVRFEVVPILTGLVAFEMEVTGSRE